MLAFLWTILAHFGQILVILECRLLASKFLYLLADLLLWSCKLISSSIVILNLAFDILKSELFHAFVCFKTLVVFRQEVSKFEVSLLLCDKSIFLDGLQLLGDIIGRLDVLAFTLFQSLIRLVLV